MNSTPNILLIRPANFGYNKETENSNSFQENLDFTKDEIKHKALSEFELFADKLKQKGINVLVIDDSSSPIKTDAVFPNNWISTHRDGTVILYPMLSFNRRCERKNEVIQKLKDLYRVTQVIDLSNNEKENKFLEGTGSIIYDRMNLVAYACLSARTNKSLFVKLCFHLNYTPVFFTAYDQGGQNIYHTNVMMCIGEKFAIICLDSITQDEEKQMVSDSIVKTGHKIIEITQDQMSRFAGNMLEIQTEHGHNIIVLSQTAFNSLNGEQIFQLEQYGELVPLSIPTIETIGGGSVRCMIAEIFLPLGR